MEKAVNDPETDVVIIGIPNDLHEKAVHLAARAGRAIRPVEMMCTADTLAHPIKGENR